MDHKQLLTDIQIVFYGAGVLGIVTGVFRYIYNQVYDYRRMRTVVTDLTEVHLPYIFVTLRRICNRLGIEIEEEPTITLTQAKNPSTH